MLPMLQGRGDKIAEVVIPLPCVRAKPRRILSGMFELQNSDGSEDVRAAGLEVCWLPHREEINEGGGMRPWRESWSDVSRAMVGTLHVNLGSGSQLPAGDSTGFSDPFCTLKIGETRFVSSVKDQTLDPVWNEDFEFGSVTRDRVLHINCYDKVGPAAVKPLTLQAFNPKLSRIYTFRTASERTFSEQWTLTSRMWLRHKMESSRGPFRSSRFGTAAD